MYSRIKLTCVHSMRGEVEESPIVLSLLLFVSAFTECHLERLVDSASATDATADAVQGLFRELVILTLCSSEPLVFACFVVLLSICAFRRSKLHHSSL